MLSDWLRKRAQLSNQSEVKPKSIVTQWHRLSRISLQLHLFASSIDWFTGLSATYVIG